MAGKTMSGRSVKLAAKLSALSASRRRSTLAQGVVAELVHQLPGLEPGDDQLEDAAEHAQQLRVALERLADARLDDLDDHRLAVQHGGAVGLADGGGAERLRVDVEEELLDRPLEVLLDEADDAGGAAPPGAG
jgi:hypothetical protein